MTRVREGGSAAKSPEHHLQKAIAARSASVRAKYAQLGFRRAPASTGRRRPCCCASSTSPISRRGVSSEALDIAVQLIQLQVLADVAHQDAARACQALGDVERAMGHLRLAARSCPASRARIPLVDARGPALSRRALRTSRIGIDARRAVGNDRQAALRGPPRARSMRARGIAHQSRRHHRSAGGRALWPGVRSIRAWADSAATRDGATMPSAICRRSSGARTAGRPALGIALEGELAEAKRALTEMRGN